MTKAINLLKQSAKLDHALSHFFLYVIYKNGAGVKKDLKLVKQLNTVTNSNHVSNVGFV